MVKKKKQSKRQTLKTKYHIKKAVKDHHKKLKKLAKKNPHLAGMQNRKKKDPGIPNLWPFKEALLHKMEKHKEKMEEMQKHQKEKKKTEKAKKKTAVYEEEDVEEEKFENKDLDQKRRWYYRDLKKVVEVSDVILEVLDARDPLGCRARDVEAGILGGKFSRPNQDGTRSEKRVILVLNKIDMVPPAVVAKWVTYLRREFPTIAFKSSTQEQGHNLKQASVKIKDATSQQLNTSASIGASSLMDILKNYSRSDKIKKSITVGIIGYPNVGKSSIINSLKRTRAVSVGPTPGHTKAVQEIRLDKNINLLDSPGVIFSAMEGVKDSGLLLRNCVRAEQLDDPITPVYDIVKRCKKTGLMEIYKIADFEDPDEFISHVANRKGLLSKGGVPNYKAAARTIINDWNGGKIPFYSLPPKAKTTSEAEIVSSFSDAFDINAILDRTNQAVISGMENNHKGQTFVQMTSHEPTNVDLSEDEDMEDDEEEEMAVENNNMMDDEDEPAPKKSRPVQKIRAADTLNPQTNKDMKKQLKKMKKDKRREKATAAEDDYDFSTDWQ